MSYDVKPYQLAKIWLHASGWNNEIDIDRLAQAIQDVIEDFVADLENEEEGDHGRRS